MAAFTKLTALGRKVQGDFVLSTARGFYLVGACLSLAAILGAVIVAIVAHGGTFGAVQQRLEHTISHLGSTAEQASAAESRIRDVDIAGETAELTRQTILRQATFAVLAQANVQPRSALRLLDGRP